MAAMKKEYKRRRGFIVEGLNDIGLDCHMPEGAFYVFPDISAFFGKTIKGTKIENASDFALLLLAEANVATVTGEAFGAPDCIRISYAASEENIRTAIARIKEVLS